MKDALLPTIATVLVLSLLNFVIVIRRFGEFNALRSVRSYSKSTTSNAETLLRFAGYAGNNFPELLPLDRPLRTIDYTFTNSTADYPVHGPDAGKAWSRVYPDGFGFVRLGAERRILCVSMFHQLHCIEKMRRALDDPDDPIATIPHLQHCMNYIRQMILCAADLTLEPEEHDEAKNRTEATGVGVTHSCRDWSTVYDTVNNNYARWTEYWETVKDDIVIN